MTARDEKKREYRRRLRWYYKRLPTRARAQRYRPKKLKPKEPIIRTQLAFEFDRSA